MSPYGLQDHSMSSDLVPTDFCRAMRCISAAIAVMLCLSVRPSVCHVRAVAPKRMKISSKFFSPSGSHTILVFPLDIPTRTPLMGASNARAYEKMTIFDQYLALSEKWL